MSAETAVLSTVKPPVTREILLDYLKAFGLASQLSHEETEQFVSIAIQFGLNPFKREIHVIPFGEGAYRKLSIVVGYEVYLKRAARIGTLDGWKVWVEGQGEDLTAIIEIHRKDWTHEFRHSVPWKEAVQRKKDGTLTSFWQKMPTFQLKKVALSQGFRLCFPDELGGLPYEGSELGLEVEGPEERNVTPTEGHEPVLAEPVTPGPDKRGSEREPGEQSAYSELILFMSTHTSAFTAKHIAWIKGNAEKSPEDAEKMLRYAKKCFFEYKREERSAKPARRSSARTEELPVF